MTEFQRFDVADYLDSEEAIAEYLNVILEENDADAFIQALGTIARARSMTNIAEKTGLSRESLYKALSADAKPRFETVMKVVHALGFTLTAQHH
jgi:probable addiction module antidote protein